MSSEHNSANPQATNDHEALPPVIKETAEHLALGMLSVGGAALDVGVRVAEETYEDSEHLARVMVKYLNDRARQISNTAFDKIDEVVDKQG